MIVLKKIFYSILILAFLSTSCGGRQARYQPERALSQKEFTYIPFQQKLNAASHYQPEMDDSETFDDKMGYVFLGIIGAAATVTAIVLPIVLLSR